ncbi:Keratin, type II cytoskeletal 8 [Sciurus carolinensis]|uniref:Keratin, type II cytoskeletal 8 n=1 Tax=Sciurus carolinensis TaxID=30640 RepID=A0AA41MBJ6_SCICA|nr:Keratin, type II cytoskeletal 8 [Sciurus carolinensis]
MNRKISYLQAEIQALKGQRASLEAAIADTEQCGELTIKDANKKEDNSGYSGGLSMSYWGLSSPGLSYGLSSFQPSFSSAGGSTSFSRTKTVVVKKTETRNGKLLSESSDVLPK